MADLVLVTSPSLAVSWSSIQGLIWQGMTQYFKTNNILVTKDFNAGNEDGFTCAACNRILPVHVGTLDHIFAQSKYGPVFKSQYGHRIAIIIVTGQNQYTAVKGVVNLVTNSIDYMYQSKKYSVDGLQLIHKMDLCNLQILDWKCNAIKNDRDWATAFPQKQVEPIMNPTRFNALWQTL
nr:hypothetical protein [uncultured Sphaerochaeta sp.]